LSYVVSLEDFKPPPRFDAVPWNRARIEEAPPVRPFVWTAVETLALNPLDADPTQPQSRNLTTTQAALPSGYYRVVFLDAADHEAPPTDPVANAVSPVPTIDELKRYVDIEGGADDELLQTELDGEIQRCAAYTGRQLTKLPASDTEPAVTLSIAQRGRRFVRVPDAREITAVVVDGVAATDYQLIKAGMPRDGSVYLAIELYAAAHAHEHHHHHHRGEHPQTVEVTGRFGFDPFPDDLRVAILTEAARHVYERSAGFADSVATGEWGGRSYAKQLGPRSRQVYDSYQLSPAFHILGGR
jgi:hypothetical protein